MKSEGGHIDKRRKGHDEVSDPEWQANEGGVVEGSTDGSSLPPHCSEGLKPDRCSIDHDELPEEKPVGPDGHPERREKRASPLPLSPLHFQSVEGEGCNSWGDTEEEA